MKKSLGRRSSSRNPRAGGIDFGGANDRRSGIPVRRAASADRNIPLYTTPLSAINRGMVTPMTKRSNSGDRNSMVYSARACFTGGTERPSRATTLSSCSARSSSYGGVRSKTDTRPIEDKQWQINAQRKIENFLLNDPDGCELIPNGSIKPITLKLFISIVDLLFKKLDGNLEKIYIHKDNYIMELPLLMKKLAYRGKFQKSWLIAVNTARSWCHALACIDFLVTCLVSQQTVDPMEMMFPAKMHCENDDDDLWDYKILLPYLQRSYELYLAGIPDYERKQEHLDQEVINKHISHDNVEERIRSLQNDIELVSRETEAMKLQMQKVESSLPELDKHFNDLKDEKSKYEEHFQKINKFIEDSIVPVNDMKKHVEMLMADIDRKKQAKKEIEKVLANQMLSKNQLEDLRQKKDSVQRQIDQENVYCSKYEDMVMQGTLELLALRKQYDDFIKNYNLEVMKYLPYGLENAMLDGKKPEEIEEAFEITQKAINSAKHEIQTLENSNSLHDITKIKEKLQSLEKQLSEKNITLDIAVEKYNKLTQEKNEEIRKLTSELEAYNEKIIKLTKSTKLESVQAEIDENLKRADLMAKQLSVLKNNASQIVVGYSKLVSEYARKLKELDEQAKRVIIRK